MFSFRCRAHGWSPKKTGDSRRETLSYTAARMFGRAHGFLQGVRNSVFMASQKPCFPLNNGKMQKIYGHCLNFRCRPAAGQGRLGMVSIMRQRNVREFYDGR